jgi:hypothetical protein
MPYFSSRSLLFFVFLSNLYLHSQSMADVRRPGNAPFDNMNSMRALGGAVYTQDGVPVPGAWVTIRNIRSGEIVFNGTTSRDGGFETEVGNGQTYEVLARTGMHEDRAIARGDDATSLRMTLPVHSGHGSGGSVAMADLKASPKAQEALAQAQQALTKNDREKAQKELEKALKEYPDYPRALALQALLQAPTDQNAALLLARRAAALSPQDGFPRAILAGFLNDSQQPDEALKEADAAIASASHLWQGHFERARALASNGRLEDALASATRADELAQGRISAVRVARTRLLAALGRTEEAGGLSSASVQKQEDKGKRDRTSSEAVGSRSFAKK